MLRFRRQFGGVKPPRQWQYDGQNSEISAGDPAGTSSLLHKIPPALHTGWIFDHMGHSLIFRQMMYVSGETAEASPETTGMIEEIVRQQVIEMVRSGSYGSIIMKWSTMLLLTCNSFGNVLSKLPEEGVDPSQRTI